MTYYFDHKRTKEDNPAAHLDNPGTIWMVYLTMLAGVIATISVSFAHLGDLAVYIHLGIATIQVCLLAYYWMHLQRSDSLTWLTALSALFFMLILFALPIADYLTRHLGGL